MCSASSDLQEFSWAVMKISTCGKSNETEQEGTAQKKIGDRTRFSRSSMAYLLMC
jgi:hypothetical protein